MIRLLQSFDFRKSPYSRPNQTWVCGRAAEGAPCRLGPDNRGRCRATGECMPRQDGARWTCTRPQSAGGPCAEGPRPDGSCAHQIPPCQPVRSVRAKRGLAARWAATVAVGLVVLALHGSDTPEWLSPGPLTAHHAEIGDCATCHENFDGGPADWVRAAFAGVPDAHAGDSRQCLTCHDMGEKAFAPHGADAQRLARSTKAQQARLATNVRPVDLNLAGRMFTEPDENGEGTACATCHNEHQGASASLTAMSDGACQSCHTLKFASLSSGHPPFGAYPYDRRTGINFDHVRHIRKHFKQADADTAPEQCVDCHGTGNPGRLMQTASFEESCASCHTGDVRGTNAAGAAGIPVIAVPGLDLMSLREAGAGIGAWPELADGELTPFMRVLLANGPVSREDLKRFRELDPLDLREASAEDIRAVEAVAWGVKTLIHDLLADGPAALRPALSDALGGEVAPAVASRMLAGLPLETVRAAQAAWFPDLAREMALHRAGEDVPIPASEFGVTDEDESADAGTSAGGGEQADILSGDGDGGGDILSGEEETAGDLLGGDGESGGDDGGDILSGDEDTGGDLLGGDGGGASDDGSGDAILGGEESTGGDLLGGSEEGTDDGSGGDILSGEEDAGGDLLGGDGGADSDGGGGILSGEEDTGGDLLSDRSGEPEETAEEAAADARLPTPNPERWSRLGGWYRDYFALFYRPRGHADPFLATWLDVTGAARGEGGRPAARAVFEALAVDDGPGKCVKCHSVDARDSGALTVNWTQAPGGSGEHSFTRFAHEPHITSVATEEGCATCHAFAPEADYRASFDDRSPATFASNFQPIGKATCESCHTDAKAGNACTQCHDYHVGEAMRAEADTRLDEMTMSEPEE